MLRDNIVKSLQNITDHYSDWIKWQQQPHIVLDYHFAREGETLDMKTGLKNMIWLVNNNDVLIF